VLGEELEILQLADGGEEHGRHIGRAYRKRKNNRLDLWVRGPYLSCIGDDAAQVS